MKTLILSDLHSQNASYFIEEQRKHGIDKLVCLGDYDDPEVLEHLLDLEMPKIILTGNHDHGFANRTQIESDVLTASPRVYVNLWADEEFKRAKNHVLNPANIKQEEEIKDKKVVYVHSSLTESSDSLSVIRPSQLWDRILVSQENIKENFQIMQENNYWILFRGHDHFSGIFSVPFSNSSAIEMRHSTNLEEDKRHIVSIGPFFLGEYALFDTETLELDFLHLKD